MKLLKNQNHHEEAPASVPPNPPQSTARTLERTMRYMQQIIAENDFASIEEANAFLNQQLVKTGGDLAQLVPTDTPRERALDLLDEAMDARGKKRLTLAHKALEIDPDCADAYSFLAQETKDDQQAMQLYRQAVEVAERALGPVYFTDPEYVGHFWGMVETRPYMRARLGLADMEWVYGSAEASIDHLLEMLRLCPGDNMGVRYRCISHLIAAGRSDEAETLMHEYREEESALMAYLSAALAFQRCGRTARAERALKRAVLANPHALLYLIGISPMPDPLPAYHGIGDESEGVVVAMECADAWVAQDGGLAWLADYLMEDIRKKGLLELPQEAPPFDASRLRIISPEIEGEEIVHEHIDTPHLLAAPAPRISRNAPCPCGSGRKYKLCCGRGV